jgi:hypothetical protein
MAKPFQVVGVEDEHTDKELSPVEQERFVRDDIVRLPRDRLALCQLSERPFAAPRFLLVVRSYRREPARGRFGKTGSVTIIKRRERLGSVLDKATHDVAPSIEQNRMLRGGYLRRSRRGRRRKIEIQQVVASYEELPDKVPSAAQTE